MNSRAGLHEFHGFVLVVLAICFITNGVGRGVVDTYTVVLLPLSQEFGWKRAQLTGVYSIYLLVHGGLSPLIGTLFDRYGPRLVYSLGYGVMAVGFWFAATLDSIWGFYLFVGVTCGVGVAASGMVPAASIVSRWFRERLSTAIGLVYSGIGLGMLIIVPSAQFVVERYGWRMLYHAASIVLALAALATFAAPWGRIMHGAHGTTSAQAKAATGSADGWTVRAALRTPLFWSLTQVYVFTSIGMFGVFVQIVVYLREAGFAAMTAATAYGVAGMLSVPSMIIMASLADKYGARRIISLTFAMTLTGILFLIAVGRHPSYWLLAGFVFFFGGSMGARGPIISAIANRTFAGPRRATIFGLLYGSNLIGAAFGAWLGGMLFDLSGTYLTSFIVSISCILIAALPFWFYPALKRFR